MDAQQVAHELIELMDDNTSERGTCNTGTASYVDWAHGGIRPNGSGNTFVGDRGHDYHRRHRARLAQ